MGLRLAGESKTLAWGFAMAPHRLRAQVHVDVCCAVASIPCSLVVTCWERADLWAVVCVVFYHFPKCVPVSIRIKGEVGAVQLV